MKLKKLKIVSPAGDIEKFYAAVEAGADEIYMGLKGFGARKNAKNFTVVEYKEALDYAHERGVKILLTLNTLMMDNEFEPLYHNLNVLYKAGLDAIIVQDFGMFEFLKNNFPKIEIHGSTQMTVSNHVEAEFLRKQGFKRVVLSRELSLEEIKNIRENTTIELEVFVSGALCVCYSGKCYMSSFIGARSGNRGMCAQPCRKFYETSENTDGYKLSPNDQLVGKKEIEFLKNIGIESVKIEGRMKEAKYVFELTDYYRKIIDGKDAVENIKKIFNRGYSKGYFYENHSELINEKYSSSLGFDLGKLIGNELILKENVILGDGVTYLSKKFEKLGGTYINRITKKYNKSSEKDKEASSGETLIFRDLPLGTKYIFKSFDKKIEDTITADLKVKKKKIKISGKFIGKVGSKPYLEFTYEDYRGEKIQVSITGEQDIQQASKKPITEQDIFLKISELGETSFELDSLDVVIEENIFIPVSVLKELKRECGDKLREKIVNIYKRENSDSPAFLIAGNTEIIPGKKIKISGIVSNINQEKALKKLGIEKIYHSGLGVIKEKNISHVEKNRTLAYSIAELESNERGPVTLHWTFNIGNSYAMEFWRKFKKIETAILSPELSFKKIKEIDGKGIQKAIIVYSKPKVMQIEAQLFAKESEIKNDMGDTFLLKSNKLKNTEVYLKKPLDVTGCYDEILELGLDEAVFEFTDETETEIKEILENFKSGKNSKREKIGYNYWKGVY